MSFSNIIKKIINKSPKSDYGFYIHSSNDSLKKFLSLIIHTQYTNITKIRDFNLFSNSSIKKQSENVIGLIDINILNINKLTQLIIFLKNNPNYHFILSTKIVFINDLKTLLNHGINSIILHDELTEYINPAIDSLFKNDTFVSPKLKEHLLNNYFGSFIPGKNQINKLSEREYEIFFFMGIGDSPKLIAERLNINIQTMGSYRKRIKTKLKLSNTSELKQYAEKWMKNHYNAVPIQRKK